MRSHTYHLNILYADSSFSLYLVLLMITLIIYFDITTYKLIIIYLFTSKGLSKTYWSGHEQKLFYF
jgi:hypothetical protein